jgi:CubicO group peptidase (beta-lactamase class C family)
MAIMMLAEGGKLSFDDNLLAYFPRFPAWAAGITLRHMLYHTSGLPDYLPFFRGDEFVARDMNGITNEDVLQRAMNLPGLEFPVSSHFDGNVR